VSWPGEFHCGWICRPRYCAERVARRAASSRSSFSLFEIEMAAFGCFSTTRLVTKVVALFYKVFEIFTRANTIGRLPNTLGLIPVNRDLLRFGELVGIHGSDLVRRQQLIGGSHGLSQRANANIAESTRWGRGAVGSAPRWHRGGRGFESHRLHQKYKNMSYRLGVGYTKYNQPCPDFVHIH
jgi:hypothetical protein